MKVIAKGGQRVHVVFRDPSKGPKDSKTKTITVYDTTVDELLKLVLEAIEKTEKNEGE